MRGWLAVLIAAILMLTVPLVLVGCKGQAGKTSSETASSAADEHEGEAHDQEQEGDAHEHEGETAEGEEAAEPGPPSDAAALIAQLKSGDDAKVMAVFSQMQQLKSDETRNALRDTIRELTLSNSSSAEVREAALGAWAAWVAEDPEPAYKAAESPHGPVRRAAANSLRGVQGPKVIEVLEKLKQDPDSSVKAVAAEVLAEHMRNAPDDKSIDVLIADLGHPDGDRSARAGMQLEQRGRVDRRVVTKLMDALRTSPNPAARHSCATLLGLTCAGTNPGQKRFASAVNATFRVDANPPPAYTEAAPALIQALANDAEPMVREAAAFALGMLGTPEASKPLARALSDPDQYVRRRAAAALVTVPPEEVKEELTRAARHDTSPAVRRFAVEAMSNLKGDEAGFAVALSLRDPDADVRMYACEVLKKIGTRKQTEALVWLFEDPDEDVRWKAVDAVARFADPNAKKALIAALNDPSPRVALAAERGVHRLGIGTRVLTKEEKLGLSRG